MKKISVYAMCTALIAACVFFCGCNGDNGLEYASTDSSCSIISGADFKEKDLVIPNSYDDKPVTGVLDYAFVRNYSLASVTVPEGATFLDDGAFYCCTNLATVNLPATLESIGYNAFCQCKELKTINYNGTKAQWYSMERAYLWDDYTGEYSIVCSDGTLTKKLNGNDLGTEGLLYEIYLKSWRCVLENGLNAASKDVEISPKYYNYDVSAIGEKAFSGAEIESVKIPEGVSYIEDQAFLYCESLSEVYLPSTIADIGREAFVGCASLTDIYFGDTREVWEDLTKDPSWDKDCGKYTVHFTEA